MEVERMRWYVAIMFLIGMFLLGILLAPYFSLLMYPPPTPEYIDWSVIIK
jgi:hypothetical protein